MLQHELVGRMHHAVRDRRPELGDHQVVVDDDPSIRTHLAASHRQVPAHELVAVVGVHVDDVDAGIVESLQAGGAVAFQDTHASGRDRVGEFRPVEIQMRRAAEQHLGRLPPERRQLVQPELVDRDEQARLAERPDQP